MNNKAELPEDIYIRWDGDGFTEMTSKVDGQRYIRADLCAEVARELIKNYSNPKDQVISRDKRLYEAINKAFGVSDAL